MRHPIHRAGALAFALMVPACGEPYVPFDDTGFVEALPQTEELAYASPGEDAAARVDDEGCATGDLYEFSRQMSKNINNTTQQLLELLDRVRAQPITTRTEDARIWGPYQVDTDLAILLTVTRAGADYAYVMKIGGTKTTVEAEVMTGTFAPGSTASDGVGALEFNFSTWASYQVDAPMRGQIAVQYDTREGRQVAAQLFDVRSADVAEGQGLTADTTFEKATGGAVFTFIDEANVGGGEAVETRDLTARWRGDGAGRADVILSGGDFGQGQATLAECWSVGGCLVYESTTAPGGVEQSGDPAACVL